VQFRLPFFIALFFVGCCASATAQVLTAEDSLSAGILRRPGQQTVLSGYGEAEATYDAATKTAKADLTRNILFLGHRFNRRIQFFSELELEHARVEAGEPGGEISLEQAFIKFGLSNDVYLVAGLFIPRIGIINENHLPTTFNGTLRPFVERDLIPATWREMGIGLYGQVNKIPGLNYSLGIMNGLDGSQLQGGKGLREARYKGQSASSRNIAITGALLYYVGNWRLQASTYYGGSIGLPNSTADSLNLATGGFANPVMLNEVNAIYRGKNGLHVQALATHISIPDAQALNAAFANNTPEGMQGAYLEVGYDVLARKANNGGRKCTFWGRYEYLDLNSSLPENGIANKALERRYVRGGLTYAPVSGVVVKAEYRHQSTGNFNQALIVNPLPNAPAYLTERNFVSLGIGYSF